MQLGKNRQKYTQNSYIILITKEIKREVNSMDDETLKIYGYVISSTYRTRSLKALEENNKTPTQIAHDAGIKVNHISKVLKELKDKNLTVCINEHKRKNRIYKLTELGEEIADKL